GLQARRAGARGAGGGLGRVRERARAGDHAEREQARREAERRIAALHLHGHVAGARARVVRGMVPGLVLVVDAQAADEAADHDDPDDRQYQDPREPAGRLLARLAGAVVPVVVLVARVVVPAARVGAPAAAAG